MTDARRNPVLTWPRIPGPEERESTVLGKLLRSETIGGSIALVAAAAAVVWAQLDHAGYESVRAFEIGPLDLEHWAADGALTLFFFLAGLELKREFLLGSLRRPADAAVPVIAAICGVVLPALIYLALNAGTDNLGGWAIPAATDIAFALAVLAVVGSALPTSLRAFLLTLAVVDDLIVIVIIAVFYTSSIHLESLLLSAALIALYALCQRLRVGSVLIYLPIAIGAWWFLHESGIHATVAGVALGLLTRVLPDADEEHPPAEKLEYRLSPISTGVAVPFFALMSAGVVISDLGSTVTEPIFLGVVLGLVLGKPIGILGGSWLVTRFTRATLDESVSWRDLTGVAVLGGVGFTVSLLVSDLSFSDVRAEEAKTAVLIASLAAALLGAALLRRSNKQHQQT